MKVEIRLNPASAGRFREITKTFFNQMRNFPIK